MKKAIIICLLQCIYTISLQAQSVERDSKKLYLNAAFGIQAPQFDQLNTLLTEQGFLPLDKVYFSRGGGFYTIFPKIPLATLFNLSTYTATNTEGNRSNWVRSTQGGTALGLVVRNSTRFQLIPYGGIVYTWSGVRVSNQEPAEDTFTGYFSGQPNQFHASTNRFMANFGLHIARKSIGKGKIGENLVLGLRAGYFQPLGGAAWKTQNRTLSEGPKVNTGGFYTSLIIAFAQ